jgi:hypothetical protein
LADDGDNPLNGGDENASLEKTSEQKRGAFHNDGIVISGVEASSITTSKKKHKIKAQKRYCKTKVGKEGTIDEKGRRYKNVRAKKRERYEIARNDDDPSHRRSPPPMRP